MIEKSDPRAEVMVVIRDETDLSLPSNSVFEDQYVVDGVLVK